MIWMKPTTWELNEIKMNKVRSLKNVMMAEMISQFHVALENLEWWYSGVIDMASFSCLFCRFYGKFFFHIFVYFFNNIFFK